MWKIEWLRSATLNLADIWVGRVDLRGEITKAAHQVDAILGAEPETAGESRPNGKRILFVSPLGLLFHADKDRHIVTVLKVWCIAR